MALFSDRENDRKRLNQAQNTERPPDAKLKEELSTLVASGKRSEVDRAINEAERVVDEATFPWKIIVPANTTATIHVPTNDAAKVTEGGAAAEKATGVKFLRTEEGRAVYKLGSGTYKFTAPFSRKKP